MNLGDPKKCAIIKGQKRSNRCFKTNPFEAFINSKVQPHPKNIEHDNGELWQEVS